MQILKTMKKGLAIVLTLAIAFSTFAIAASATSVSSDYDSELAAMMSDKYDSSLFFDNADLANYDIISKGSSWSAAGWNTRYNYIQYSSGKPVEIASKQAYNVPYGFTAKWEIFTKYAEAGTSEFCVGDLRFVTNYETRTLHLMYGETELAKFETGCEDKNSFANKYCFNEYTMKYIDGVITVTRLITGRDEETTASNTPITWTLPNGRPATEVPMPSTADFSAAKVVWKSSSEIGKCDYFTVPAPFISQYNGNIPTFSNPRLTGNVGYSSLQAFADFVDGLAANLNEGNVAKARAVYETIVANGSEGLVSEVAPLLALIEDAEQALAEGGGSGPEVHEHAYTSETTDATCTTAGKTVYTCECGDTFEVEIPIKDHVLADGVCTECGYKPFGGGAGTEANPFLIENLEQFERMRDFVNNDNENYGSASYKLTADIVINENVLDEKYHTNSGNYTSFGSIGSATT
ncbi:MAG: hypothetical protein IJO58_05195, partial [Clostridia bacterium]|nr:hypothetical protein [Clostridia bacterium]